MTDARTYAALLAGLLVAACASSTQAPPAAAPARELQVRRSVVMMSEPFTPQGGAAAIAAFVPEVAPVDSGGECSIRRSEGNGATIAMAVFPRTGNAHTRMSATFDSAGHLVRFFDRRGAVPAFRLEPGASAAQRDSAVQAAFRAVRATTISFDYAIDQAVVSNSGGGRPTDAVTGSVRAFEDLERLGPPRARLERLRKLCGV